MGTAHLRVGEALTKSRNWTADLGGAMVEVEIEMWRAVSRVIRGVCTLLRLERTTIDKNELLAVIWYARVCSQRGASVHFHDLTLK